MKTNKRIITPNKFTLSLPKGFTLIELLVVIAIIGILAGFVLTNLQGARERARDVRRKADLKAVSQSLRLYYNDNQTFPATGLIVWGNSFTNGGTTTYMNRLPFDPSHTSTNPILYVYTFLTSDTYTLTTQLENASDPDIPASQLRCSGSGTYTYYVCQ